LVEAVKRCLSQFCFACVAGVLTAAAAEPVSFVKDIAPILREKCLPCHGPEKAKGEFRLDTFELLNKPGSSKTPPLQGGAPEKSHLYELITAADADDRMPQKDDPLPKEQVVLMERWIREGAKFDGPDAKAGLASLAGLLDQPPAPEIYRAPVPITALAFHPSGKEIAVSGYHEITLWSSESGALLRRITNVAQRTTGLAYNGDGSVLAAASGTPGREGEAKLFDTKTGARLRTLMTTPDVMLAVDFNADSSRIACAGTDNTIRIFEVGSGKLQLGIEQHADWVTAVAFSPNGSNIVSASRDKTVRVFDANTGELESTYAGHTEGVFAAMFSLDGKQAISGGRDKKVHVWEIKDAKKVTELGIEGEIQRMVLSTNGLFVAAENGVRQFGPKYESVRTLSGHSDLIYSLAIHEPSGKLASGGYDGEVRVWKISDGSLERKFIAAPLRLTAK
jgi:WD40 repeat protein